MARVAEMLRSTLGEKRFAVLCAVAERTEPVSGRAIAGELKVSPTTASEHLTLLEAAGLVRPSTVGRAKLWRLDVDSALVRAWLREAGGEVVEAGASPASTGGAGVTFERKVVADYLGRLLVGDGAAGLGEGRVVVSVALQQAPEFTVDDVVVEAALEGEVDPSRVLALAARRTPLVVQSDVKSQKLFKGFVQQLMIMKPGGPDLRLGLAVSGMQEHSEQLKVLAAAAGAQSSRAGFFKLVRTAGKFNADVQGRLKQVEGLVAQALVALKVQDPPAVVVEQWTWELLSRLVVLSPRMEGPDDSDWAALPRVLRPFSAQGTLLGGTLLRDRLLALADEWAPVAASVDLSMVRRRVHDLLDSVAGRHAAGWQALGLLADQARDAVGDEIVSADGARRVRLDRSDVLAELTTAAGSAAGVLVHGESGVGKSAVALGLLSTPDGTGSQDPPAHDYTHVQDGEDSQNADVQVVCMNLRHLPATALQFEGELGAPLEELLAEVSAPTRLLVVDGADAVSEGRQQLLTYVVNAAVAADLHVVAVTASDVRQLVADTLTGSIGKSVVEVAVAPLTDAEVDVVVAEFRELEAMAANPRSRELLRRPVVVDLLVRGGVHGVPVSDFDAMKQIWDGLVRRRGASDRGTPDARNLVMLQLARQALEERDQLDAAITLDADALEGLRKDGLLRTSQGNPFRPVPEFAHDEVRRYAVAWLLLGGGDLIKGLVDAGVPRWALGAARLACQAKLIAPDTSGNPVTGRFMQWQDRFNKLVEAGHGERWADVPGEALLTLGDPRPVLRDAWPQLRADNGAGVQRLVRLVDQRLRDGSTFVRVAPVEPLIELLLEDETPWASSEPERTLLMYWLRSLARAWVPEGYALRQTLRARLVDFCATADERLRVANEQREANRAAQETALTDEERAEREARFMSLPRSLFQEHGYPRSRRRRKRPEISREITDEVVVELLALLGADLGADGEALLRRIAECAPDDLQPALEGVACGYALARYRQGFLADMVVAYYLDEEQDGTGSPLDKGVREHGYWGIGVPLAASWRGPFRALLQTDFGGGVAALNRILNHAAMVRARWMTGDYRHYGPVKDSALDPFRFKLSITGAPRVYIGDSSTWNWYRGTGVGPYPCMSALQALELVCDEYIGIGAPLERLISILLDGCENVAMVALVVSLLVRHLDKAGTLLDRYLAEPDVWKFEFGRRTQEHGFLRASSDGIVRPERRHWSLGEAGTSLVLAAGPERAEELRLVGKQLVEKVRRRIEQLGQSVPSNAAEMELSAARAWASGLDPSTYSVKETDDGWEVQSHPPAEVTTVLTAGTGWVKNSQEAMRLTVRYHIKQEDGNAEPITTDELVADLEAAAALIDDSQELDAMGWDARAAVAGYALTRHLEHGLQLPDDSVKLAADIVLEVGEGAALPRLHDIEESYFSQGADHAAARVLPLLLTPDAEHVRRLIDGGNGTAAYERVEAALAAFVDSGGLQTELFLARGLDYVWASPCTHDPACPHRTALRITIDMMRECVLGPCSMERQGYSFEALADPIVDTLPAIADDNVLVSRLDAAIRALGPAVVADICISGDARALLDVLIDAQRRALLASDGDTDDRGSHALAAARALLTLGDDNAILTHIDAYVDNSVVLNNALRAISAAAEESPHRADTARRVWPQIVQRVLDAHDAGHETFKHRIAGRDYTLAALIPTPAGKVTYLHSEHAGKPVVWWDPAAWHATVDRWLGVAAGKPTCVDALVQFIRSALPTDEQARLGVPWVSKAALANSAAVATRCYTVAEWLIDVRVMAQTVGMENEWQRTVDALVVAGDSRLAPYSE